MNRFSKLIIAFFALMLLLAACTTQDVPEQDDEGVAQPTVSTDVDEVVPPTEDEDEPTPSIEIDPNDLVSVESEALKVLPSEIYDELVRIYNGEEITPSEKLNSVLLPTSLDITIPKLDMSRIRMSSPVTAYTSQDLVAELLANGYSEEEIAHIDLGEYMVLSEDFMMTPQLMSEAVRLYPELIEQPLNEWTNKDYRDYIQAIINEQNIMSDDYEMEFISRHIALDDARIFAGTSLGYDGMLAMDDKSVRAFIESSYMANIATAISWAEFELGIAKNEPVLEDFVRIITLAVENEIGASQILSIEYATDDVAYIMGVDVSDMEGDKVKGIVATYDADKKDFTVIYENYVNVQTFEKLSVNVQTDGTHVLYATDFMLHITDAVVTSHLSTDGMLTLSYSPFENIIAYSNAENGDVHFQNLGTGEDEFFFEMRADRNEMMSYSPKISGDGQHVLFLTGGQGYHNYKNAVMADMDGRIIADIDISGGYSNIMHFWTQNGFALILENYGDSPNMIIREYNVTGEQKSEFSIPVSSIKDIENAEKNVAVFTATDAQFRHVLCLIDFDSQYARVIYTSDMLIFGEDISPNGEKIVWIESENGEGSIISGAKMSELSTADLVLG